MKNIFVSIPSPCTENWNEMTVTEQGRHCASCNKIVVDFSNMSNDAIVKYLLENRNKKICGNFLQSQIKKPLPILSQRKKHYWPAIAAMLVAGIFQLTPTTASAQLQGNVKVQSTSTAFEKNPMNKSHETEPASDSLSVYTIQILSKSTKKPLQGIYAEIDSLGTFITDSNGEIQLKVDFNKLPTNIKVQLSGINHLTQNLTYDKRTLVHSKRLIVHMTEVDNTRFMIKGDVGLNYE